MPAPQPVVPYGMQRGVHVPEAGNHIVVDIDGERISCEVVEVQGHDLVIAKLKAVPVGKGGHGHKKDDIILVKRSVNALLGTEIWAEVTDREIRQREAIERRMKEEREAEAAAEAARIAEIRARDLAEIPRGRKVLGPRRSKIRRTDA